jgi:ABC-type lipoprotein release transport system permease subunit
MSIQQLQLLGIALCAVGSIVGVITAVWLTVKANKNYNSRNKN